MKRGRELWRYAVRWFCFGGMIGHMDWHRDFSIGKFNGKDFDGTHHTDACGIFAHLHWTPRSQALCVWRLMYFPSYYFVAHSGEGAQGWTVVVVRFLGIREDNLLELHRATSLPCHEVDWGAPTSLPRPRSFTVSSSNLRLDSPFKHATHVFLAVVISSRLQMDGHHFHSTSCPSLPRPA